MEKGYVGQMIIKVFKISTSEMCTMNDKRELIKFVEKETESYVSDRLTIEQIMRYLPIEDYCRVK